MVVMISDFTEPLLRDYVSFLQPSLLFFLWGKIIQSCRTRSEQVKNRPFERGVQLIFVDFIYLFSNNWNHLNNTNHSCNLHADCLNGGDDFWLYWTIIERLCFFLAAFTVPGGKFWTPTKLQDKVWTGQKQTFWKGGSANFRWFHLFIF
jgi:hypothetical protein